MCNDLIPQLRMVKTGAGEVGEQGTERNADKQQRLEFLHDAEVEKSARDNDHNE